MTGGEIIVTFIGLGVVLVVVIWMLGYIPELLALLGVAQRDLYVTRSQQQLDELRREIRQDARRLRRELRDELRDW